MNYASRSNLLVAAVLLILFTVMSLPGCGSGKVTFDGDRAYVYLTEQCDFGPRNPGSDGASKALEYFKAFFETRLDTVELQNFEFTDTISDTTFSDLTNIIARFNPGRLPRVLLCAHWDTRPYADMDPNVALQNQPILGANDGASGCAVLMELANLLPHIDCPYGVDIVLFDAEDYGESGNLDYYCIGSKYYVENIDQGHYAFGILLDMVGATDMRIYRERYSHMYAKRIVDQVWSEAAEQGASHFVDSIKHTVYDDHLPFLEKGIPVIDIIDFDYPSWHTQADTPDKCSPSSLAAVGKVLLALLSR
ncbi:MAG: M28 family peptidase [candidate division Zixibacteria bacterium]|nr:M28 family peptidase [candidate division Zixibacteria bacterium]MBU1469200.1 M28 family peptidase [candidate division Zixibacteria bacterium]MBU2626562.1 M28 family peptidase [candidate division Zixibacteria bacterium]